MDHEEEQQLSVGQRLLKLGWTQGSLFRSQELAVTWNQMAPPNSNSPVVQVPKFASKNEKFVLISQDCDLESISEDCVEVLLCKVKKQQFLDKIGHNSSRWFVVDRVNRLVAEAGYRALAHKEILETLHPEPWPNPRLLGHFIRWLARRYNRPPFPNEFVKLFQIPVQQMLTSRGLNQPGILKSFNTAVSETRVTFVNPPSEDPPYDIILTLIIHDRITEQESLAVKAIVADISSTFDSTEIHIIRIETPTYGQFSVQDYYDGQPLSLDTFTYGGDEVEGQEPFRGT